MTRLQAGLVLLLAVPVIWGLMWWGWRGRLRRDRDVPRPPAVPHDVGKALFGPVEGVYLSTTRAGSPLDRVAAHRLGFRSAARASVHREGVLFERDGEPSLWLPAGSLLGVRRTRGMAGKVADPDSVVVLAWQDGDFTFDTGFRPRYERDRPLLTAAAAKLVHAAEENANG